MNESKEKEECDLEDEFSQEEIQEIVSDFQSQLNGLGAHPDKVKINTLSMIADDYQTIPTIAKQLYGCMRAMLVDQHQAQNPDIKLPLVYLLDSIFKNVGGIFIGLASKDANIWVRKVFETVKNADKTRLRRVHSTWRDAALFTEDKLKVMARCFEEEDARTKQAASEAVARKQNTERQRTAAVVDAVLSSTQSSTQSLSLNLKNQMQLLLDDLKRDMPDAVGLTLDGLVDMNPALYENLKVTAMDMMRSNNKSNSNSNTSSNKDDEHNHDHDNDNDPLAFLVKSEEEAKLSKDWESVGFGGLDLDTTTAHNTTTNNAAQKLIDNLQRHVRIGTQVVAAADPDVNVQAQAQAQANDDNNAGASADILKILIASSVAAKYLTGMVQHYESVSSRDSSSDAVIKPPMSGLGLLMRQDSQSLRNVDTTLFTTEGLKEKNTWVIGSLYDEGLPHVSKADGRRFATEIQLSKHLDYMFKKR